MLQQHLLTFEQEWTDKSDGRTLPSFVTDELRANSDLRCNPHIHAIFLDRLYAPDQIVPVPVVPTPGEKDKVSLPLSHYISWSHFLKKTFEIDTICPRCKTPLRLIAMIETEDAIEKILSAIWLTGEAPKLCPARPPPSQCGGEDPGWRN